MVGQPWPLHTPIGVAVPVTDVMVPGIEPSTLMLAAMLFHLQSNTGYLPLISVYVSF